MSVSLPLGEEPKLLTTGAWVRWVNSPPEPKAPMLPPGMGLEFLGLDPATRAALESFVTERVAAEPTVH